MKRRRAKGKRFDPTDLRKLMEDGRVWCALGVVVVPDGETTHFEIVMEGGSAVDVMVEVETQPDQLDLTCRLGSNAGGLNAGVWAIPDVGTEVAILIPDGKIDFQPVIVATLGSRDVPDGVAPNVTVVANGKVLVHDGDGGAAPLPTLAEFKAHTHGTGVGPSTPTTDPIPGVGPIAGTTVLEAK